MTDEEKKAKKRAQERERKRRFRAKRRAAGLVKHAVWMTDEEWTKVKQLLASFQQQEPVLV